MIATALAESACAMEEAVEFVPGEVPWRLAGAKVPDWVPPEALPAPKAEEGVVAV